MIIKGRKHSLITCKECRKEIYKANSEIKRNLKIGRSNFCSLGCSSKHHLKQNNHLYKYYISEENLQHLSKFRENNKDEYTSFRYYLRDSVRKRQNITIDLDYLRELWQSQNGMCPYTNIPLILQTLSEPINPNYPFNYASLDRIDSSKGYEPGNVEFVSFGINMLKNKYSKEAVLEFIKVLQMLKTD